MRKILGALCFATALAASPLTACHDTGTQDIYMSPDSNGARRRSEFVTDSENISLIMKYSTGREDLTIRAEIFPVVLDEDSKFKQVSIQSPEVLGSSGIGSILAFTMQRKKGEELPPPPISDKPPPEDVIEGEVLEPWPTGVFRARVFFDADVVGEVGFRISWSECPNTAPVPNSPCRQFLPRVCKYSEDSAVPRTCECATHVREQKWVCTPE